MYSYLWKSMPRTWLDLSRVETMKEMLNNVNLVYLEIYKNDRMGFRCGGGCGQETKEPRLIWKRLLDPPVTSLNSTIVPFLLCLGSLSPLPRPWRAGWAMSPTKLLLLNLCHLQGDWGNHFLWSQRRRESRRFNSSLQKAQLPFFMQN